MILRIKPKTKSRPRSTKNGRPYTDKATREFEAAVRQAWEEQHDEPPCEEPVHLSVIVGQDFIEAGIHTFVPTRPKGVTGDLDNYVKSISDGLNGVAYTDDKQIVVVTASFTNRKLDDHAPTHIHNETTN
jgi:crossover junction endodeoxyribonuclease RusA